MDLQQNPSRRIRIDPFSLVERYATVVAQLHDHQGDREAGTDGGQLPAEQGHVPRGITERPAQPLLRVLHGQGEGEDEDRRQPPGVAEGCWIGSGLKAHGSGRLKRPKP